MITKEDFDALLKRVEALEGKVKRKTKLPVRFYPTEEHQNFAGLNNIFLSAELDNFRLHHEAKGTLSANWNSSFSTWLRNAVKYKRNATDKREDDADRVLGRGAYSQGMNLTIRRGNGSLT